MGEAAVQDFKCLVTKQRSRRNSDPRIFQVKLRGMLNPNFLPHLDRTWRLFYEFTRKKNICGLLFGIISPNFPTILENARKREPDRPQL